MSDWYTLSCEETKKVLGRDWQCCNTCHEDYYSEWSAGELEKYTKFRNYLFGKMRGKTHSRLL